MPRRIGYPAGARHRARGRRDLVAGCNGPTAACFPPLLAPNKDREIGGGRATRQPGQVRKEAALTRSGSGRSSVSYLFFAFLGESRRLAARRASDFVPCYSASRLRETISCGSTDERRWPSRSTPTRPE